MITVFLLEPEYLIRIYHNLKSFGIFNPAAFYPVLHWQQLYSQGCFEVKGLLHYRLQLGWYYICSNGSKCICTIDFRNYRQSSDTIVLPEKQQATYPLLSPKPPPPPRLVKPVEQQDKNLLTNKRMFYYLSITFWCRATGNPPIFILNESIQYFKILHDLEVGRLFGRLIAILDIMLAEVCDLLRIIHLYNL